MAKFNVGDPVQAMYFHKGTVLGPGTVKAVEPREDGGTWVTVAVTIDGDQVDRQYNVSKSGATDYLLTQAESDALRALNPNFN